MNIGILLYPTREHVKYVYLHATPYHRDWFHYSKVTHGGVGTEKR